MVQLHLAYPSFSSSVTNPMVASQFEGKTVLVMLSMSADLLAGLCFVLHC